MWIDFDYCQSMKAPTLRNDEIECHRLLWEIRRHIAQRMLQTYVKGTCKENVERTHHEGMRVGSFFAAFIHNVCPRWSNS
jgi:hypothetical protein